MINKGGSSADAEDVFQEAVMVFYEKVVTNVLNEENCNLGGFIIVVSKNIWTNKIKKDIARSKHHEKAQIDFSHEDDFKELVTRERQELIDNFLDQLGSNCKTILKAIAYEGLTMKELAKKMGFGSVDVAKSSHYRCKKKMISFIEENKHIKSILSEDA